MFRHLIMQVLGWSGFPCNGSRQTNKEPINNLTCKRGRNNISMVKVCSDLSKAQARGEAVTKREILLLVLEAAEESLTPVQLQKSLFLVGRLMSKVVGDDFYHFEPYHYGPFNGTIYDDIRTEAANGFINVTTVPGQRWSCYSISNKGREEAAQVQASEKSRKNIKKIVTWVMGMTFEKLVATIYRLYPEFKENSVFYR